MLFFNGDDSARGTEEFRTLRSRLYHAREKMPLKKILVTSALPKEGKSFTAANLAQVLVRQHGRRVLLIDADLRGPRLHMMLGTTSSPGLADYLQGRSDEFSIMQRGPMENLFFIPSGQQISDPAELVANGRLKLLLQRVEALFDWIIIDSPPAVPVSDASVLAKACDGVLMVVRSNATPVDMARRARQEFPDEALVGVVLNGTDMDAMPYTRYYYDAYHEECDRVQVLREVGKRDPAVQSLLSAAHAGSAGGRGHDCLVFVPAGDDVAEPRQLAAAQRRRRIPSSVGGAGTEDSGGHRGGAAAFALVRPVRLFQSRREVGARVSAFFWCWDLWRSGSGRPGLHAIPAFCREMVRLFGDSSSSPLLCFAGARLIPGW